MKKTVEIEIGATVKNVQTFQGSTFGDLLSTLSAQKLHKDDFQQLSVIGRVYEQALIAARGNRLVEAGRFISEAEQFHLGLSGDSLLFKLLNLHSLPLKAYFYYKLKEYAVAEELLVTSISNNSDLINKGFFMVECHRIQQLHNLARMYFKRREFGLGADIIGQALGYLDDERIPAIGLGWSTDALRQNPLTLRSDMALQLALETAGELLPPTEQDTEYYYSAFGSGISLFDQMPLCSIVTRWYTLKTSYLSGSGFHDFIEDAVDFIVNAPTRFDILKLSVIVDITDCFRKNDMYDKSIFEDLKDYGQRLRVAPHYKQACLTYIDP